MSTPIHSHVQLYVYKVFVDGQMVVSFLVFLDVGLLMGFLIF